MKGLFEPLEFSSPKELSFKTALLFGLISTKRVCELITLSVHPSGLMLQVEGYKAGCFLASTAYVKHRCKVKFALLSNNPLQMH